MCVDEAQDCILIDCALLRRLSNNPKAFFFAGDTAQTISKGSSFRFEGLKSTFWNLEERNHLVVSGARKASHPAQYQLNVNYRSHAKIVALGKNNFFSHYIFDLIETRVGAEIVSTLIHFWPNCLDRLNEEKSQTSGPHPIWIDQVEEEEEDSSRLSHLQDFVLGHSGSIDFGANSAILVRTEGARHHLRSIIGEGVHVLYAVLAD